jgi:serine/threonine protein phosphatase PrpC
MPDDPRVTILTEEAEAADRLAPIAGGVACVRIRRAPAKDGRNEDAAIAAALGDREGVIAVADGAGGHAGAAEAAAIAVNAIDAALRRAWTDQTETRSAILRAIDDANRAILDMRTGAACTLAVAEIEGRVVQPYHVGDAQILIVGQRGRVRHQSVAHSPVGYAVHAGLIDEPEAIRHEDRHVITNAVGMEDMRIEVGPAITLAARDTVLVASDGVYDNLYLREIVDAIRTGPLDTAADRLLDATRARMLEPDPDHPSKPDDIGIALFRPSGR